MKTFKAALLALTLSALASCGPIMGQAMKVSEGIKSFKVTQGSLSDLTPGQSVLVYGPMEITEDAYYICKGEDASQLSSRLATTGLFKTDLFIEHTFKNLNKTAAHLKATPARDLKEDLNLDILPDKILFGTILTRQIDVAPARGVVMTLGYRLEFYDIASATSTIVEVTVKERAQECVVSIVDELMRQMSR